MAIKSSRGVTSGKGTPQRLEGQNGDITIRTTPFGKKLFVKDANKWHSINLDVNTSDLNSKINALLKDVRSLKNSTRNRPVLDSASLRTPGSANVLLKNNSADFEMIFDDNNKKIIGSSTSKVVRDVVDGNPSWQIGSSDTENFKIQTTYKSSAKGLNKVSIGTNTASGLINEGQISLNVDGEDKLILNDSAHEILVDGVTASDVDANSQPVGIHIKNKAKHPSNTNTRSSIRFSQEMENVLSETFDEVASIVAGSEGTYNNLSSTADGYLSLQTALNGTLTERLKIASNGDVTINNISSGDGSGENFLVEESGVIKKRSAAQTLSDIGASSVSALNDLSDVSYSSGDLTITSLDKIVADDFVVDSGASIELDSHNGNFVAKKAGTEFSAANSAYAGMILGYTRLTNTSSVSSFEIQNSMTVEHDTHKITFKTPPSELVEIEMSALINVSSTSTHIETSLSTQNATDGYLALAQKYEYDGVGVFHSDGEADDEVINIKWVLDSSDLAAIGSDNTFWVAFSTNGETKTAYLQYGGRAATGQGNHPFIIKATALPATIYEGS